MLPLAQVGVIEELPERALTKLAKPVGVIGALSPSTNPEATPVIKAINASDMGRCWTAAGRLPRPPRQRACRSMRSVRWPLMVLRSDWPVCRPCGRHQLGRVLTTCLVCWWLFKTASRRAVARGTASPLSQPLIATVVKRLSLRWAYKLGLSAPIPRSASAGAASAFRRSLLSSRECGILLEAELVGR